MKEESGKAGLKLNIQKIKIMESGPITSWKIDGETVERVTDFFFFLDFKITDFNFKCLQMVTVTIKLKEYCSLGKKL